MWNLKEIRTQRGCSRTRRGAALVEFAICLPVFVLIVMATVETCRMIYLTQSIKIATYECARLGITPEATVDVLQTQCDLILEGRGLENYTMTIEPSDPSTLKYEDLFTVTISIPASEAALVGSFFFQDKIFTESSTIMAEY